MTQSGHNRAALFASKTKKLVLEEVDSPSITSWRYLQVEGAVSACRK
jgi:hypothetical protein